MTANDSTPEKKPTQADTPEATGGQTTGQEAEAAPAVDELSQQLQQALAERDAHHERWQRTLADWDNFRKRAAKEAEQERLYSLMPLIRDLLPGLDNLQRALQAAEQGGDIEQLVQGVQMVFQQFHDVLAKYHIEVIPAVGQPFDPNLHEAVQQMPSNEHPPMTVLHEVERGYRLHDRIVRPSKVIVSSAAPQAPAES